MRIDGDVLTTEHDHFATHEALRLRAARDGVLGSVTPYAVEHVRLGCGLQVDEADVDAAIAAVARLRG